jgi:hypothetical protein
VVVVVVDGGAVVVVVGGSGARVVTGETTDVVLVERGVAASEAVHALATVAIAAMSRRARRDIGGNRTALPGSGARHWGPGCRNDVHARRHRCQFSLRPRGRLAMGV